jgi:hypothetical protein
MAQSSREIDWSAILAFFRRSGLTHIGFCRSRGIYIHPFRDWLSRPPPGLPARRSRTGRTSPDASSTQTESGKILGVGCWMYAR